MTEDLLTKAMTDKMKIFIYAQAMGKTTEAARYREEIHSMVDILLDNHVDTIREAIKGS